MYISNTSTARRVIDYLLERGFVETKPGVYIGNRPWDPTADSNSFEVMITGDESGTAVDRTRNNAGYSLYSLADMCGIQREKPRAADTKRAQTPEEYAADHGVTLEQLTRYGWHVYTTGKRHGFRFVTRTGERARFLDGMQPRYQHAKGYRSCWYKLDEALDIAAKTKTPLIMVNGEISAVVGQIKGLPTFCQTTGSERTVSETLLEELITKYPAGNHIVIALDCDLPGRNAAVKLQSQLIGFRYIARTVDLGLDKGGDVCDYLKYTDDPTSIYKLPPLETVAFVPPKTISADKLQSIEFAPPDFIVDELFIPGCYLVVGKPKSKKSWLMLHVLLQVAKGGMVFGSLNAAKHEALYLDLEGNENGISQRLKLMHMLNETWPAGLHFGFSETWNLRGVEALAQLDGYLTANPKVRFVVIDVLQNFREPADPRTPAYAQDYNAIKPIQRLAHKHNVVMCLIHHTRKAKSDDPFDEVSGTTGLTGAVDGTLIIKRSEKDKNATILETRFRNLPDKEPITLIWDMYHNCHRIEDADAVEIIVGSERRRVLKCFIDGEPHDAGEIAAKVDKTTTNVRMILGRLESDGYIGKIGRGKYQSVGDRVRKAFAPVEISEALGTGVKIDVSIAVSDKPAPGMFGTKGYRWRPITDDIWKRIPIEYRAALLEAKEDDDYYALLRILGMLQIQNNRIAATDLFYLTKGETNVS
jgi:hypothetical protein